MCSCNCIDMKHSEGIEIVTSTVCHQVVVLD